MKVFQYPVSRFPFHNWIEANGFQEFIHTLLSPTDEKVVEFHDALVNDARFLELHDKYLKYIAPFFESNGLKSEAKPLIRFHRPSAFSFTYDVLGRQLEAAKTIAYTPLTPMFQTNSLSVESQVGLGDFNFLNMRIGDFYLDHSRRRKTRDTYQNGTGVTSVCLVSVFK